MKRENERYVKLAAAAVGIIAVSLLIFFLLFRLPSVLSAIQDVLDILAPFLYGAVIAYILAPICNRLEALLQKILPGGKRLCGGLSILLALLLAALLLIALVMLVFPQVWESILGIVAVLPGEMDAAIEWLHDFLAGQPEIQTWWDSFSNEATQRLQSWLQSDLLPTAQALLSGVGGQVIGVLGTIKNLFLGILISIYMLASRKQLAARARLLLCGIFPRRWAEAIEDEVRYADKMFNGFLMGKLLDSAIIGVICFVVTTALGFGPSALISVIVGVTNIIPFFGPFIGAVPCALLLLLEDPVQCLVFLIFLVILQQVDGNLIGPKILGNTTGVSSFGVLFAILLFGGLWGVPGMIIGVPLFAVFCDIGSRLIRLGLRRHGRDDLLNCS